MLADRLESRFPVMGTTAHLVVVGGSEEMLASARRRLVDLEHRWSRFLPDSELCRLNNAAGVPAVVSAETYQLVADSIDAWRQTGGVFDPTVGATMNASGYDRSFTDGIPEMTAPARHLPAPGPAGIVLHPYGPAVHLPPDVQLDFGGMAKGAAADLVVDEIRRSAGDRVPGCLINVGGDIRAAGPAPRPEGWTITLDCPGATETRTIRIAAGAVCTSTTAKRHWHTTRGPEHHLRDPRTGAPMQTGITSVTVVAARAAQAEVLTKAVFAAGPDRAAAVIAERGATGLLVLDDGRIVPLPGLRRFLAAGGPSQGQADSSQLEPEPAGSLGV